MSVARGIRTRYFRWAFWFVLGVVSALALMSCSTTTGGIYEHPYERDSSVFVIFNDSLEIERICTERVGRQSFACALIGAPTIWIENPCDVHRRDRLQSYAGTFCHELCHTNGWAASHPDIGRFCGR